MQLVHSENDNSVNRRLCASRWDSSRVSTDRPVFRGTGAARSVTPAARGPVLVIIYVPAATFAGTQTCVDLRQARTGTTEISAKTLTLSCIACKSVSQCIVMHHGPAGKRCVFLTEIRRPSEFRFGAGYSEGKKFDQSLYRVARKSCTFFNTPYLWNRSR